MVYGPISQQIKSAAELNTSNRACCGRISLTDIVTILDWFTGNKKQEDIPDVASFNWVDVRDGEF